MWGRRRGRDALSRPRTTAIEIGQLLGVVTPRGAVTYERQQSLAEVDRVEERIEPLEQQGRDAKVVVTKHRFGDLLGGAHQGRGVAGRSREIGHLHPQSLVVDVLAGRHLDESLATDRGGGVGVAVHGEGGVALAAETLVGVLVSGHALLGKIDPLGGRFGDPLGLLPGFGFGVGDDRTERDAETKGATVLGRDLLDRLLARRHGFARLAPEGVHVGLGRSHLDGRRGGPREEERDAVGSDGFDRTERVLVSEELSVVVKRCVFGPDAPDDRHLLAGAAIARVVRDEVALSALVGLVAAGDEVDAYPTASREVIERGRAAGHEDGLGEAGSVRDHHLEVLGAVQHRRGDGPSLGRDRPVADEHSIEAAIVVGARDRLEVAGFNDRAVHPVDDWSVNEWSLYLRGVPRTDHSDDLDWHVPVSSIWCETCFVVAARSTGYQSGERQFNANIRVVATGTIDSSSGQKRPLVAVGYGPRCVPVMQLTEAAADVCDLLWMIDGSIVEMRQMADLLNHFGPVLDVNGLEADQIVERLSSDYRPDGLATYLDANMTTYAKVAAALQLPFHSLETAEALTDKARQRQVLAEAGVPGPSCHVVTPEQNEGDLAAIESDVGWPAVLKPRSAQGSRYTFLVRDAGHLNELLGALGPTRPDMVLEGYIGDDPQRDAGPYADYVSVETVVSTGVISHLALTGRFPMAENFRETGFFIPAALAEDAISNAEFTNLQDAFNFELNKTGANGGQFEGGWNAAKYAALAQWIDAHPEKLKMPRAEFDAILARKQTPRRTP